ncbi:MAG: prepilin peptidase [Betaproteobacteria bacterium]|nr:prepilin peptidase [Betaproteobacteria bacterium]
MGNLHWLNDPTAFALAAAVLGMLVGSFLNVVIHRLPKMMEREWRAQCAALAGTTVAAEPPFNLATPRSACPGCGHRITALENIPVISFAVLGGKCSACKTKISVRYPLVEILTGALFAGAALTFGWGAAALTAMVFLAALVALSCIDFDTQLLPDDITLPLIWAGLVANLWETFVDLNSAVIGAIAGYLVLWTIYWLFKLVTGKEGMGLGDLKLLAAVGAWLGWKTLPFVVLASSLVGAVLGVGLIILAKRGREVPMPFGPYLAIAAVIALFFGNAIVDYYLTRVI